MKSNKFFCLLVAVSLFFAPITLALATTINPLNQASPSGMSTNTVPNWARGWQFTVNVADVWVTELGLITPSTGNYEIYLFDVATETALASTSASGGSSSWQFDSITPVELTNGSDYLVELYGVGDDQTYFYGTSNTFKPTGAIEYVTMKYCNECSPGEFPTLTLDGYNYGLPDIGYQIGKPGQEPIPEPTTMLLFGTGLAGLAAVRRRKK